MTLIVDTKKVVEKHMLECRDVKVKIDVDSCEHILSLVLLLERI